MSSTLPPDGPQGPEYLEQGAGSPLGHEATPRGAGSRKTVLIAAAAVVAHLDRVLPRHRHALSSAYPFRCSGFAER